MKNRPWLQVIAFFLLGSIALWAWPLYAADSAQKGTGLLPEELKGIQIKPAYFPGPGKPAGTIQSILGRVVVVRPDFKEGYEALAGNPLHELDTIFTLKDSRCRIRLNGGDVVTLGGETRLETKSASEDRLKGEKQSAFAMLRGKAMFYALKLLRHRSASMSVETPTAVIGVRGTQFYVQQEVDRKQGVVSAFDGRIEVLSAATGARLTLSAGQTLTMTSAGLGRPVPTPPESARTFRSETEAPPPPAGSQSDSSSSAPPRSSPESAGAAPVAAESAAGQTVAPPAPDTSSITQTQTTNTAVTAADPVPDPRVNTTAAKFGYTAAILTNTTAGRLEEVFSSTVSQDPESNVWLRGLKKVDTDYMRGYGGGWSGTPYFRWAVFDAGTMASGQLSDTGYPISRQTVGNTPDGVQEWGYWQMTTPFSAGDSSYMVDNRAYYIWMKDRPTSFTSLALYRGDAYGTYWSATGGTNMTGTFSCDVNLTTAAVTGFTLSVSGGGATASINDASGAIASDATFQISGGSWNLNGTTPDQKSASGSLNGTQAEYIGGAWGMSSSTSGTGAVGIYRGDKNLKPTVHNGFYAMMLTDVSGNQFDSYLMSNAASLRHQDLSGVTLAGDPSTSASMEMNGGTSGYKTPTITVLANSVGTGIVNGLAPVTNTDIGYNPYMEWGEWTQPSLMMPLAGGSYAFNNKGYWIAGDITPDARMTELAANNKTGTYSGTARGTYYSPAGGTAMTGTFGCNVAFAAPVNQITNFTMSVSEAGGTFAKIEGATGTFNANAGYRSNFEITGGTASITGSTANFHKTYGAMYGSQAQAIGGVWAITGTVGAPPRAVGMFQGTKTGP